MPGIWSEPTVTDAEAQRYRLDLRYDGTYFHGWAKQEGLRSVQGSVEDALFTILREPTKLTVAGRTDAGVHATGQVAHFDFSQTDARTALRNVDRFRDRVNGLLASGYSTLWRPLVDRGMIPRAALVKGESDVLVTAIARVPPQFDARFAAMGRKYRYVLAADPAQRDPLSRSEQWWAPFGRLDMRQMNDAAALLLGERDFLSFCKPREGATTIRTLRRLEVTDEDGGAGRRLSIHVEADAFCHSMVRSLVGALVEVGRGARSLAWVQGLIEKPSRDHGVPIAPARGLTLTEVQYPPAEQWAERIQQSRRRRDCGCASS